VIPGIIPAIKVTGTATVAGFNAETITEGLDGLRERLSDYRGLGARFAKWRAVIDIAEGIPTAFAVEANAHALARYAALCQENDIVPIVEPEVLMDGAHSIGRCEQVTEAVLASVFRQLFEHRVMLEGIVLKPNMVIAAESRRSGARRRPWRRPRCAYCGAMSRRRCRASRFCPAGNPRPRRRCTCRSSTSSGRCVVPDLQLRPRAAGHRTQGLGGVAANFAAGQKEYAKRARLNGLATTGRYAPDMESQAA